MPFGGVGDSGYGRFGGRAAIAEFTDLRWLTIETGQQHYRSEDTMPGDVDEALPLAETGPVRPGSAKSVRPLPITRRYWIR